MDEDMLDAYLRPQRLLTFKEVAIILRCSESHVRKLISRKENPLRCTRISPRRNLIARRDLDEFMMRAAGIEEEK